MKFEWLRCSDILTAPAAHAYLVVCESVHQLVLVSVLLHAPHACASGLLHGVAHFLEGLLARNVFALAAALVKSGSVITLSSSRYPSQATCDP